jgi:hypothetical protein
MMQHLKLNRLLPYPFLLLLVVLGLACGGTPEKEYSGYNGRKVIPEISVQFLSPEGAYISEVEVQISDDIPERSQGLMDVRQLPENHGMLFIFEEEQPLSFWMANTPLPLDIMYVNSDSVIVSIYHSTTPFSEKGLPSGAPALYVVETNGGYAINQGIEEGYRIRF